MPYHQIPVPSLPTDPRAPTSPFAPRHALRRRQLLPWALALTLSVACGNSKSRDDGVSTTTSTTTSSTTSGTTSSNTTDAGGAGAGGSPSSGGNGSGGGASLPTWPECVTAAAAPSIDGSCVLSGNAGYAAGFRCNPVTQDPCRTDWGEACDFDGFVFRCVATGPSPVSSCGGCDPANALSCAAGFTCDPLRHQCLLYCCDDSACPSGTTCVMQTSTPLGICQAATTESFAELPLLKDLAPPSWQVNCDAPTWDVSNRCVSSSLEGFTCNPLRSDCEAQASCDQYGGGFACYGEPETRGLCEACTGPGQCAGGHICVSGKCARLCCRDSDCDGDCTSLNLGGTSLGICGTLQ